MQNRAYAEFEGLAAPVRPLCISRCLVEILTRARWHMIRQVREEGSSWSQVGTALSVSKQAAYDFYQRNLD